MKIMLDEKAKMPTRAFRSDAGLDLYSRENWYLGPGEQHAFDTGVHMVIDEGFCGLIVSKSGLNVKRGISSTGLIDAGYTGSIVVNLQNFSPNGYIIHEGDKISQIVILPIATPELELVDSLEETERGANGFGSSGK